MTSLPPRSPLARTGRAQLSLVEHALCPLDSRKSLARNFTFETAFHYTDRNRNRKRASVNIAAVNGLSPCDDFYLWGLLGLALSQPEPSPDFYATPYWCLKNLGIVDGAKKGSEEYRLFREAVRRLAGVRYSCSAFYDPLRCEHREVSFGFLSYSLPLSDGVSRAWRFAWDPIFWELCSANAGALRFDLPTYRDLSPAGRRLYLLLKKLFWRNDQSPELELRELGINVLGLTPLSPTKEIKRKVLAIVDELLTLELVQLGIDQHNVGECITRHAKGVFRLKLYRGAAFNRSTPLTQSQLEDSPLFDPLQAIGFDRASIARILKKYPAKLVQLWADITLAAVEQGRVKESPPAFFQHYIDRATEQRCTPPDWWRDIDRRRRQAEEEQRLARARAAEAESTTASFDEYLAGEARDAFERVMQQLKADLRAAGRTESDALAFAKEHALIHFRNKFRQRHETSPT